MKPQPEPLTRIPYRVAPARRVLDLSSIQKSQTYSLTVWHVEAVKEMRAMLPVGARRGVSEGEIVRRAIEKYRAQFDPDEFAEPAV